MITFDINQNFNNKLNTYIMKTKLLFCFLFWGIISQSQTVSVINSNIIQPYGVASDDLGNFIIADVGSNSIVKFTSVNDSSKPIINLELNNPRAVAFKGAIYIVDSGNGVIKKFQEPGTLTSLGYGFLSSPRGVAVDNSGNVYVTSGSNVIRMTGTGSNITTLIGSLVSPEGIAIDSASNFLYVTCGDGTIKKANINGTGLTTFASGLASPAGIVLDWSGNVFVAEYYGGAVKKITPSGVVSTYASGLQGPNGIALNNNTGNIYVTEAYTNEIKMISTSGTVTAIKRFHNPTGIVCDASNNIYITDASANCTKKINNNNESITQIGFSYNSPFGIAIRKETNSIFIANTYNNSIELYNYVTNTGNALMSGGIINRPHAVAADLNYLYIANTNNNNILKYGGSSTEIYGNNGEFYMPMGITVNGGHIFVADTGHQDIKKMTTNGTNLTTIATGFIYPTSVLVDASGKIYVADRGTNNNGKIVILSSSGTVLHTITTGLLMPYSITFDSTGDVLIADIGDSKIKKLDTAFLTVSEYSNDIEAKIFPNPTTDFVEISSIEKIKKLTLFDETGKQILEEENPVNKISFNQHPKGLYIMNLVFENDKTTIKKILKN